MRGHCTPAFQSFQPTPSTTAPSTTITCLDLAGDDFAAALAGKTLNGTEISTVLRSCADVLAYGGCTGDFEDLAASEICPQTCDLCGDDAEAVERRWLFSPRRRSPPPPPPITQCSAGIPGEYVQSPAYDKCRGALRDFDGAYNLCRYQCNTDCTSNCAQCHPASATLELEGGRVARMDEVRVGDKVRTPSGFAPVTGFLHAERTAASYLRFTTAGGHVMSISALHHMIVNGEETDPTAVRVGDLLDTPKGAEAVRRVEPIEAAGKYHPFVSGGRYYVDGVQASDYVSLAPRALWPFVQAYVEARFRMGVPIIPVGAGLFPNHAWAVDLLARMGTPVGVQRAFLFPLTMSCGILTELANAAAEHLGATAGTAAAAAAALVGARQLRAGMKG